MRLDLFQSFDNLVAEGVIHIVCFVFEGMGLEKGGLGEAGVDEDEAVVFVDGHIVCAEAVAEGSSNLRVCLGLQ